MVKDAEPCYWCGGTGFESGYHDRSYDVFAIVGNVRNGRGFAGVPTGTGFVALQSNRGVPEDLSDELKEFFPESFPQAKRPTDGEDEDDDRYDRARAEYGCGWGGDHSFGWLTARELIATDEYWNNFTQHVGVVSLNEIANMLRKGVDAPSSWCGDTSGQGVRYVSPETARLIAKCCVWDESKPDPYGFGRPIEVNLTPEAIEAYTRETTIRPGYALLGRVDEIVQHTESELVLWARKDTNLSINTRLQWSERYRDAAGRFYSEFIPALAKLGEPDNVRVVFGFDS